MLRTPYNSPKKYIKKPINYLIFKQSSCNNFIYECSTSTLIFIASEQSVVLLLDSNLEFYSNVS